MEIKVKEEIGFSEKCFDLAFLIATETTRMGLDIGMAIDKDGKEMIIVSNCENKKEIVPLHHILKTMEKSLEDLPQEMLETLVK